MKVIISLAVLAAVVSAQSPADLAKEIPACVVTCIRTAAQDLGCAAGDFKCECDNKEAIAGVAAVCASQLPDDQKCTTADLAKAAQVGDQICALIASGGGSTTGGSESSSTSSGGSQTTSSATTTSSTTTRPETTSSPPPATTSTPGAGAKQTAVAWVGAAAALAAMAL